MTEYSDYNYYEILEVGIEATPQEIHRAYEYAKNTYKQDNVALYTMFSADEAKELLKMVEEAYSVLSNPILRVSYDKKIKEKNILNGGNLENIESGEFIEDSENRGFIEDVENAGNIANLENEKNTATIENKFQSDIIQRKKIDKVSSDEDREEDVYAEDEIFDGPFLQKVRIKKQLGIEQLSNITRVSKAYLIALEHNNYAALPAKVFVRGFILQVSKTLGLDAEKVAKSYMKYYQEYFEKK